MYAGYAGGAGLVREDDTVFVADEHSVTEAQNGLPVTQHHASGPIVSNVILVGLSVVYVVDTQAGWLALEAFSFLSSPPTNTTIHIVQAPAPSSPVVVAKARSVAGNSSSSSASALVLVGVGATLHGVDLALGGMVTLELDSTIVSIAYDTQSSRPVFFVATADAVHAVEQASFLLVWSTPSISVMQPLIFSSGKLMAVTASDMQIMNPFTGLVQSTIPNQCLSPIAILARCLIFCEVPSGLVAMAADTLRQVSMVPRARLNVTFRPGSNISACADLTTNSSVKIYHDLIAGGEDTVAMLYSINDTQMRVDVYRTFDSTLWTTVIPCTSGKLAATGDGSLVVVAASEGAPTYIYTFSPPGQWQPLQ